MLQRPPMAVDRLGPVVAAVLRSEGALPPWRLGTVDRAGLAVLAAKEAEAAAGNEGERLRVVWRLVHRLREVQQSARRLSARVPAKARMRFAS